MRRPHSTHQFSSRNAASHQYTSPTKYYYGKLPSHGNDNYDEVRMTPKSTQRRLYTEAPYFSHLLTVQQRLHNKKVEALLDQYKHENLILNKQIEVLLEDKKKAYRPNHDFHLTNHSGNFNDSLKTHRKLQNDFQSKKKGKKYHYTSLWEDREINPQITTRKASQKQKVLNSKKHETYFHKNQKPSNTITSQQVASNAQKQIISREAYLNRNTQTFIDNLSQSLIEKSFIEKRDATPNSKQTNNKPKPPEQNPPIQQQKHQDNLFYTVKKFIFGQQNNQEEKVQPFKQIEKQIETKSQRKSIVIDIVKNQLEKQSTYKYHRNNKPYLQNYTGNKLQIKRLPKRQSSSSKKKYLNLITRVVTNQQTESPLQQENRGSIIGQM